MRAMGRSTTPLYIILLLVAGCATQPSIEPVTSSEPIPVHNDILVSPPKGDDWYRMADRRGPLEFGLKPPSEDLKHTFLLLVGYWNGLDVNDPGTPAALKAGVAKNLESRNADRRHSITSSVSSPYRFEGTDCVHYDITQEERDNPGFPAGTVLTLTDHGFFCRHPYSSEIVQAFYSERYKQGEKSLLHGTVKEEAESFLNSIQFTRPSS